MVEKKANGCCTEPKEEYRVEAVVGVDERGQMVIPKDMRALFGIKPGDKMALVVRKRGGRPCCIHMFRADEFDADVKRILGGDEE
jgi:AbrB family looped-hinge helix DNA binding protein